MTLADVLAKAVEAYRREAFLRGLNGDYAQLRANEGAFAQEQAERLDWDATLSDGIEVE